MKPTNFKTISITILGCLFTVMFSSCYKQIADTPFPAQSVYMPAATNGNYVISSVAVPGQSFRYSVDVAQNKFIVPLSAFRAGINQGGDINVAISTQTDTVNKLITTGILANTVLLPADKYTLPTTTTIPSGGTTGQFAIAVNLDYLLANLSKSVAIGVKITTNPAITTVKNTTVIVINSAFLVPVANFTFAADASIAKQYNFSNTSANGATYSWDFGDGSQAITDKAPSHVFAASGTYTVTLTVFGAAGTLNPSVKTATVIVP